MTEQELQEFLALEKQMYLKLVEAVDLTQQLTESVNRNDDVSITLFLNLRQKTLFELQELTATLDLMHLDFSPQAAEKFSDLRSGAEAESPAERLIADCILSNTRITKRLAELDKAVNQKLCGEKSFYLE